MASHRRTVSSGTAPSDGDDSITPAPTRTTAGSKRYSREASEAFTRRSRAESIVIPNHLLGTISERKEWQPDRRQSRYSTSTRTDPLSRFDVVQIAYEQRREFDARAHSIAVGGLERSRTLGIDSKANDFGVAGGREPLRKTSLPTVIEGSMRGAETPRSIPQSPTLGPQADPPERPTTSASKKKNRRSFIEVLAENSVVFRNLANYDIGASNYSDSVKSRAESIEEPDPFSDPIYVVPGEKVLDEESDGGLTRTPTALSKIRNASVVQAAQQTINSFARKSSLADVYEKAKARGIYLQRKRWVQILFEYSIYALILLFIYFVLVGRPLWNGAVWWLYWVFDHKFSVAGTWSITIGLAFFYAFAPLVVLFEKEPPMPENVETLDPRKTPGLHNTALLIPCYKSEKIIGPTLEAALKIFPPEHIYVIANGNNPTPLDKTEDVCNQYGVNHIWSPIGSKIVAQFVGCYAAKQFDNVLLIDDDCALPANFPIVSDRMTGKVKCIGYTIKSVGPQSSKGTLCQQAQDLEYKISGLQRDFAGKIGSATFPHGAISLWNTKFLINTFHTHPGFSVSEDWFFGHVARKLGCRIKMCTAIFVETETPSAVFFAGGGSRGGFGEMTIFKQRFYRWNFFFVNGMYYNLAYILFSWKLGFWEIGAKLFVFQEVYETLLYLLAPFVLPISFIVRPAFCGYLMLGTFGMYFVNVTIFNEIHLRRRNERIGFVATYLYYMPYKIVLTAINIFSCYWSLWKYATYFAKRHPKVIEDEKAVEVVLRLEENPPTPPGSQPGTRKPSRARRMTITAVGSRLSRQSWIPRTSIAIEDVEAEHAMASPPMTRLSMQVTNQTNPFVDPPERTTSGRARVPGAPQTQAVDFALRKSTSSSALGSLGSSRSHAHSEESIELEDVPGRPFAQEFNGRDWVDEARKASMAKSMV